MADQQRKAELRAFSLAELQKAEDDLRIAMVQTQGVIGEYSFMSPSDGDFALDKALTLQHQAMDAYVAMFRSLTKLMLQGAPADKGRLVKSNHQPRHGQITRAGQAETPGQEWGCSLELLLTTPMTEAKYTAFKPCSATWLRSSKTNPPDRQKLSPPATCSPSPPRESLLSDFGAVSCPCDTRELRPRG